jgi:hypothetical protein
LKIQAELEFFFRKGIVYNNRINISSKNIKFLAIINKEKSPNRIAPIAVEILFYYCPAFYKQGNNKKDWNEKRERRL